MSTVCVLLVRVMVTTDKRIVANGSYRGDDGGAEVSWVVSELLRTEGKCRVEEP
jgi:hypothetical protein